MSPRLLFHTGQTGTDSGLNYFRSLLRLRGRVSAQARSLGAGCLIAELLADLSGVASEPSVEGEEHKVRLDRLTRARTRLIPVSLAGLSVLGAFRGGARRSRSLSGRAPPSVYSTYPQSHQVYTRRHRKGEGEGRRGRAKGKANGVASCLRAPEKSAPLSALHLQRAHSPPLSRAPCCGSQATSARGVRR